MNVGGDTRPFGTSSAPTPETKTEGRELSEKITAAPNSDRELEPSSETSNNEEDDFHPGLRLWIIIISLAVTLLLTALENTVISVAMPYIVTDLGLDEDYIWITNAFFICR